MLMPVKFTVTVGNWLQLVIFSKKEIPLIKEVRPSSVIISMTLQPG